MTYGLAQELRNVVVVEIHSAPRIVVAEIQDEVLGLRRLQMRQTSSEMSLVINIMESSRDGRAGRETRVVCVRGLRRLSHASVSSQLETVNY